jgi:glycosyltransferase involved in cell wall biosynthesis
MNTILCSAYAINPYNGSEDGMGWNFVLQIARFNKVIAVTRKNTQQQIMQYMSDNPSPIYDNVKFIYFDLPRWTYFWKRGSRGAMIYYYLWQYFLPIYIKRLNLKVDIVHNLNFHNDWAPSRLWILNKPFVWGPIGHHPRIPKNYIRHVYGFKQYLIEEIKWIIKNYFWKYDPNLRKTIEHAQAILAMNSSVTKVINTGDATVYRMTSVSSESFNKYFVKKVSDKFTVLSAGRFVPLKGFDITIKSFARFYSQLSSEEKSNVQLVIVGEGPYKNYLIELADSLQISHAVKIYDWLNREEYKKLYEEASVFLFPSHEGAGMVVAEAMSYGLPIICFKNVGPGEFVDDSCGIRIAYNKYDRSITDFADALLKMAHDKSLYSSLSKGAIENYQNKFDWNLKGEKLKDVYDNLLQKAG